MTAVTWQTAANSSTSGDLRAIVWSGERFVAVGEDGSIVYSNDGDTWHAVASLPTSNHLNDVAWSGKRFVAVGSNGTILVAE